MKKLLPIIIIVIIAMAAIVFWQSRNTAPVTQENQSEEFNDNLDQALQDLEAVK